MNRIRLLPLLALLLLIPSPALAWNNTGHKVTAEIAWEQLSPPTRQHIVDTLRQHPRFNEDFTKRMPRDVAAAGKEMQDRWVFQQAATWPDMARGLRGQERAYNHPTWHYVDFPLFLDECDRVALAGKLTDNTSSQYPTGMRQDKWNVLQALKYSRAVVADPSIAAPAKAIAYCWLMHLVGDLHQPLHSTALYSVDQFPDDDRGGNDIPLAQGRNLHSLWDGLLGRDSRMSNVQRIVVELKADREAWNVDTAQDIDGWAQESHKVAEAVVYDPLILQAVRETPPGQRLSPIDLPESYRREAGQVARRQIVAAGLRLGEMLKTN